MTLHGGDVCLTGLDEETASCSELGVGADVALALEDLPERGAATQQLNFAELVNVEELAIDDTEPLRAELDSFISAVLTGAAPEVPAEDGLAAVEIATRIVEAIRHQRLD